MIRALAAPPAHDPGPDAPLAAVQVQRTTRGTFVFLVQTRQPKRTNTLQVAETEDAAWEAAREMCWRLHNRCPERP